MFVWRVCDMCVLCVMCVYVLSERVHVMYASVCVCVWCVYVWCVYMCVCVCCVSLCVSVCVHVCARAFVCVHAVMYECKGLHKHVCTCL